MEGKAAEEKPNICIERLRAEFGESNTSTWSTRLERIPKCFLFLVTARCVVNIMKARPDQCLESNQQKKIIYSFPKAVCIKPQE